MSEEQIEIVFCEYCQESVPVDISTEQCTSGCNNPMCPYDIYDEGEVKELDFNDKERSVDDEIDYSKLVEGLEFPEDGC